jgi:hypothetical protein
LLRLFARGLAIGVASVALTVAVVSGIGWLTTGSCDSSDQGMGCRLHDLGVVVLLIAGTPVLLAMMGPLVAWLLRFRPPGCLVFAAPAGWLAIWIWLAFSFQGAHWLAYSLGATAVILLISYCLSAWLASAIESARRSRPSPRR